MRACIVMGYGVNCEEESNHAVKIFGGRPKYAHFTELLEGEKTLDNYDMLFIPGGFSWGDDHGAGTLEGATLRYGLGDQFQEFVERDSTLILGVCNGYQTLVAMGLLPGLDHDYTVRKVSLKDNAIGNFRDQWVNLKVNQNSPCVFTKDLTELELPIRNAEGRFYASQETLDRMEDEGLVVLQYSTPEGEICSEDDRQWNPSGALRAIAGTCDPSGKIFGLMPHPEAATLEINRPNWTKRKLELRKLSQQLPKYYAPVETFFRNAVRYVDEG